MSDTFQIRLKAAAGAAWWMVLIWWLLLMVSWGGSLVITHVQPDWVLKMIGGNMTWAELQRVYIWMISSFKMLGLVAAMIATFLSIWSTRLRRLTRQQ